MIAETLPVSRLVVLPRSHDMQGFNEAAII